MARYIAIIGFNSKVNAAQFSFNNPTLSPQNVEVTQGFTTAPGIGQVAPGVSTPTTWVMVTSDSLNQLITTTQGRPTSITFDTQTNQLVNNTNNIDPNSITVTQNQQDIFKNGILQTASPPQPPAVPQSLQDQITQYNLQTQNLLDQLNQYLSPVSPIVPVLPNSLQDQITQNQLMQQNLNDQLNLYLNPPQGTPSPALPQSFQDQVTQFNLQTQNLLDQLNQFFTPPTDTPIPFQPIYDNPDLRKMLQRQKFVVPPDSQDQPPDVPIDPNLPPLPPPIEVPTVPYPPGFLPEPDTPQFDPSLPAEEITPHGWPPPGLFDDPKLIQPTPSTPGESETPPSQLEPFFKTPKILPISDSGEGGGGASLVTSAIFVAAEGGWGGPGGVTVNARFLWSTDAINWNNGNFNDSAYPTQLFSPSLVYGNRCWVCKLANTTNFAIYVLSIDGKNWQVVYTESAALNGGTLNYNTALNGFTIALAGGSNAPKTVVVSNPVAPNPNYLLDDFLPNYTSGLPFGTAVTNSPAAAGNIHAILTNQLPTGVTAVRFLRNNPPNFQYTTTPITTTIVNSGQGWPAATWLSTLTFDNNAFSDASNNQIDFALPAIASGVPSVSVA